jgi:hypothetical protein
VSSQFYACEYSAQVGEQLIGSAPQTENWLLLEYPRGWAAQAYDESDIPDAVKAHIDAQLALMPLSRLQLIQRRSRESLIDLTLYVIHAGYDVQRVRRFVLPTLDALLALPLAEIADGRAELGEAVEQPVVIICTNAKRDTCCGRYGLPLYRALAGTTDAQVWQTNHIGGHRFAATLVTFPHGIYYGRMHDREGHDLLDALRSGEMITTGYRGRACLSPPAQAAEYYLRQHAGSLALDVFTPPNAAQSDDIWQVRFRTRAGGTSYTATLSEELTPFDVISNSGEPKGKPGVQYRLVSIM